MIKEKNNYITLHSSHTEKELQILNYKFWRQRIELSPGFFTPGYIIPDLWEASKMPADLSGKSFLDIGANDGMFSFLAEKKGASEVYATDLYSDTITTMKNGWSSEGIKIAKAYLNSNINIQNLSIYDIEKLNRKFDYVFCSNVIAWLDDIPKAISIMSKVTNQSLIINDGFLNKMNKYPILRYEIDQPFPYRPNITFIKEALKENGFKKIDLIPVNLNAVFLKQTNSFPLFKLPSGSSKYPTPFENNSDGVTDKDLVLQATGYLENRFYFRKLGWVNSKDLIAVPYRGNILSRAIKKVISEDAYSNLKFKISNMKDEITVLSVVASK